MHVEVNTTHPEETRYWVAFHRVPYVGGARLRKLRERFGDLGTAWSAPAGALGAVLDDRSLSHVLQARQEYSPDTEMARIERLGIRVVTLEEDGYPALLREIPAPPPVLYVKGALVAGDRIAVAMVGTRKMTAYGRDVAFQIATDLAAAGVTIVSGLARGIDAIAHEAAVRAEGRTVAVMGSGVNVIYPPEHRTLAGRIEGAGALISDYPPDRKPDAQNFPARNRIVAGLTLGTIVVEAPERSGTLITSDFAADYGREVFVVPGSVFSDQSRGCHRLLRNGARLVTSAADVLEDLGLDGRATGTAVQQALPMDEDERRVLALLTGEPQHIDEVAEASGQPVHHVAATLLTLELQGMVRNLGAQHYARR